MWYCHGPEATEQEDATILSDMTAQTFNGSVRKEHQNWRGDGDGPSRDRESSTAHQSKLGESSLVTSSICLQDPEVLLDMNRILYETRAQVSFERPRGRMSPSTGVSTATCEHGKKLRTQLNDLPALISTNPQCGGEAQGPRPTDSVPRCV